MDTEISIGEAISVFLAKSRIRGAMQAVQITQVWSQLMGTTIAKYTDKVEIKNSILYIHTNVAPLKQELSYQKQHIVDRVNEALKGKVIKDVVIR